MVRPVSEIIEGCETLSMVIQVLAHEVVHHGIIVATFWHPQSLARTGFDTVSMSCFLCAANSKSPELFFFFRTSQATSLRPGFNVHRSVWTWWDHVDKKHCHFYQPWLRMVGIPAVKIVIWGMVYLWHCFTHITHKLSKKCHLSGYPLVN